MAHVTYTGASSTSPLVVSSGGNNTVSSTCDTKEQPPIPTMGVGMGVGGYDLMAYQRLAALYAPPPNLEGGPPTAPPTLLASHDHLLHGNGLDLKEGLSGLAGGGGGPWPYPMYYPYDTLSAYPFTSGYGMAFDAARRKNATRETTATLKAWLNEHKKNPYPTKGEKIMLAIITKMTLTQVSTWFANARRRLKKENKMTWEPRNKTDDDDDDDDHKDDDNDEIEVVRGGVGVVGGSEDQDGVGVGCSSSSDARSVSPGAVSPSSTGSGGGSGLGRGSGLPPSPAAATSPSKPRIWSLADMAMSSSPTPSSSSSSTALGKMGFHRPLHLDTSPYARPSPPGRLPTPQEALLQVYAKSLGLAPGSSPYPPFPHGLNGFASHLPGGSPSGAFGMGEAVLPPTAPLSIATLSGTPLQASLPRPVATRPPIPPPTSSPNSASAAAAAAAAALQHVLPGGAKITPAMAPPNHHPEG